MKLHFFVASFIFTALNLMVLLPGFGAHAADLSWSGTYRFEGTKVEDAELDSVRRVKAYYLHHLVLEPKIVAADGLTIYGRFDLLNNTGFGPDSQAGQALGSGPRGSSAKTTAKNSQTSNVLASTQAPESLAITRLYAVWTQEFGQLVVGRTPTQFGLGINQNAGNGMFDHWFTSRDMVGYKMVLGNLFIMPILGKIDEGRLDVEDDVNDYILHVQYENPETDLLMGLFYQLRVATGGGNDYPQDTAYVGSGTVQNDSYKSTLINLFVTQKIKEFTVGVEAGMLSGETGVKLPNTAEVKLNGIGLAGEIGFNPANSKWTYLLKGGWASGDDPGTRDTNEGFVFNKNYDVAMLMFNHPLGSGDTFRTGLSRDKTQNSSYYIDNEAISNAIYFAPSFQNKLKDNLSWGANFVYAFLDRDPYTIGTTTSKSGTEKDLGYEFDFNLTFKPFERLTWMTEVGLLFPGQAWKGGQNGFENKFAYGITTKAAITF